ncbi:MAG: helix-hairpin-helix domain-containing protein [Pseudoxanthomonas sp.]
MKARSAAEAKALTDLPNIGKATAGDFRLLGIDKPQQLIGLDPYHLYDELCRLAGTRHDPCVIDVFISAVRFMEGAPPLPWWDYTEERKRMLATGR